jgi:hypothetical protein
VGYDYVPVPRSGKVYKIKNAGLMVEGAVYNVSIKQYHDAHVLIMKLGTLPRQNDGFLASMYTRFTIMS